MADPAAAAAPVAVATVQASVAGPPLNEFNRAAQEKENKEKVLQEKLDKRAAIVVTVLQKFVGAFYTGRQQMLDEARAAEAAKKANKGKRGGKKKKKEAKDDKKGKDAGKPKKPPPTPVQQAWITFLADMDDRINKQKRVFLDDLYRAVAAMEPRDQSLLRAILATTNNKILPLDGMNINQLNIKAACEAACEAAALTTAVAVPLGSNPGLSALQARGASASELLSYGFKEGDLLRVQYPTHAVVAASQHDLTALRRAGVSPQDLLQCPDAPELSQSLMCGQGMTKMRQAGYTASEVLSSGLGNLSAMAQAGYSLQELRDAGCTDVDVLRTAGYGAPECQPPAVRATSMKQAMYSMQATMLPAALIGTKTPRWAALVSSTNPSIEVASPRAQLKAGAPAAQLQ